jgi:hypothetical protein
MVEYKKRKFTAGYYWASFAGEIHEQPVLFKDGNFYCIGYKCKFYTRDFSYISDSHIEGGNIEQFEKAWAERKFVFGQTVSIKDVAEEFWNKAQASVVVELPNTDDFGDEEILFKYKELVEDILKQAGITVK